VGPVALDACVLIGFFDPGDAHHQRAVEAFRIHRRAAISIAASAYGETMVKPLARGYGAEVDEFLDRMGVEIVPIDRAVARRVAALRSEHPTLRSPDLTVIAAAQLREAQLLTFDARLARFAGEGAQS
jgi:predicted nucleic acid-binding protein